MMAIIYHLNKGRSRVWQWALTYVKIYESDGVYAAGKYFADMVPDQLHDQVTELISREFLRKGIDVTF